jgi:exportin-5
MSRLDVLFYSFSDLPGPLSHALFSDAHALSSHQMSVLLNMARYLVDDCPVDRREHFLPPLLAVLFTQVDNKITSEWDMLSRMNRTTTQSDNLAEEMKGESILRTFTYSAVTMIASLMNPTRESKLSFSLKSESLLLNNIASDQQADAAAVSSQVPPICIQHALIFGIDSSTEANGSSARHEHDSQTAGAALEKSDSTAQSMRTFILSNNDILEPTLKFLLHTLTTHDQRSTTLSIRVVRSLLPHFASPERPPEIINFFTNDILKAAIDSLHDEYFVEIQKDLAQLIASIFLLYSPISSTPSEVLLSLPGVTQERFEGMRKRIFKVASERHQRSLILDLLSGVRGVSVAEQGRIRGTSGTPARAKGSERQGKVQQQYLQVPAKTERGGTPDLGGVADMFDES